LVDVAGNVAAVGPSLPLTSDPAAPTVTALSAASSAWSASFPGGLQAAALGGPAGVALPVDGPADRAAAATPLLPWANVDRVTLAASEPVSLSAADLAVIGGAGPGPAVSAFTANATRTGGTWSLSGPLPAGRLLLTFADSITDVAGNRLAGVAAALVGGVSPAGGVQYRVNVLPGDGDRSGSVNARDLAEVRAHFGAAVTGSAAGGRGYTPLLDFNGDGAINAADYRVVRARLLTTLPPAPPAVQAVLPARSAYRPVRAGVLTEDRGVIA
jgi:hypothetical protein